MIHGELRSSPGLLSGRFGVLWVSLKAFHRVPVKLNFANSHAYLTPRDAALRNFLNF